jgi:ribonuclease T1
MRRRTTPLATLAVVIAVAIVAWWNGGTERTEPGQSPKYEQSSEQAQIDATLALIARGGPFPHRQDGAVFENRERRLPQQPRGYYREYTVPTPGAQNRGARRIVKGKNGETWYTRDHYRSFIRLD